MNRHSEQNDTLLYVHDMGTHITYNNYYKYNTGLSYNNSKLFWIFRKSMTPFEGSETVGQVPIGNWTLIN